MFYVWPENFEAAELFEALSTQWCAVAGFGGIAWLGLNYEAVQSVMWMKRVKPAERWRLLDELRDMEVAALEVRNRNHD